MKKLILIALLGLGSNVQAQDYYHGLGGAYNIGIYNLDYTAPGLQIGSNVTVGCPIIYYKSTLAFEISRSSAFGISAYPGLGGMISNTAGSYIGYQLPILGELYFGDLEENNFNMGLGFAFNGILTDSDGGNVFGPQFSLGGQFNFRDQIIGIRGSYTYGLNKTRDLPDGAVVNKDFKSIISVGIHYMFGLN